MMQISLSMLLLSAMTFAEVLQLGQLPYRLRV